MLLAPRRPEHQRVEEHNQLVELKVPHLELRLVHIMLNLFLFIFQLLFDLQLVFLLNLSYLLLLDFLFIPHNFILHTFDFLLVLLCLEVDLILSVSNLLDTD